MRAICDHKITRQQTLLLCENKRRPRETIKYVLGTNQYGIGLISHFYFAVLFYTLSPVTSTFFEVQFSRTVTTRWLFTAVWFIFL